MTPNREIKVYGTLVNATVNDAIADSNHNDVIVYANQVYDNMFGNPSGVNNFQDLINKNLKQSIDVINGDEYTEGSINYAVKNGYIDHSASISTCESIIDELL